jgi:hypothetical protein
MGFRVEDAEFVRKTNLRLFRGLFAPRLIEVRLRFKPGWPSPVPFEDLKGYVVKAMSKDPGFWESGGYDVAEITHAIQQAGTPQQVFDVLRPMLTAGPPATDKHPGT